MTLRIELECRQIFGAPPRAPEMGGRQGHGYQVPETLVPTLSASGGRSSARAQRLQTPPTELNEVRALISTIAGQTYALCNANTRVKRVFPQCRGVIGNVRALEAMTRVISVTGNPEQGGYDGAGRGQLHQKARAMHEALTGNGHRLIDPVRFMAPAAYRRRLHAARVLFNTLRSDDNRVKVKNMMNASISDGWKRAALDCLSRACETALHELQDTPIEEHTAALATRALSQRGSSVIGEVREHLGNGAQVVDLVAKLVSFAGYRSMVTYARNARAAGAQANRLLREWCRAMEIPMETRATARRALQSGDAAALRGVHAEVNGRLEGRLGHAFAALGAIQGLLLVAEHVNDDDTIGQYLADGVDFLGAANDTMTLIGAAGEYVPVSRRGMRCALKWIGDACETSGRVLGVVGGVMTVYAGALECWDGCCHGDMYHIAIGPIRSVAGVAAVAGVLLATPGAQLLAVALALGVAVSDLVHGIVEGGQHYNRQVFDRLIRALEDHSQLVDNAGISDHLAQLKTAGSQLSSDWGMYTDYRSMTNVASGGARSDTQLAVQHRARLTNAGFGSMLDHMYPMPGAA